MIKEMRKYSPLLVVCFISLISGFYSFNLYASTCSLLNGLKIHVESVQIVAENTYTFNITFIISNPSDVTLKLVYLQPRVYLNGVEIALEEPAFIKYPTGNELSIPPESNVSIIFLKRIKPEFSQTFEQLYENADKKTWFFNVYITLKNVPLMNLSTLQRRILFQAERDDL